MPALFLSPQTGFEKRVHSLLSQINGLSFVTGLLVTHEEREEWEKYSIENYARWKNESMAFQEAGGYDLKYQYPPGEEPIVDPEEGNRRLQEDEEEMEQIPVGFTEDGIAERIYVRSPTSERIIAHNKSEYVPTWQHAPFISIKAENRDRSGYGTPQESLKYTFVDKVASMVCIQVLSLASLSLARHRLTRVRLVCILRDQRLMSKSPALTALPGVSWSLLQV